ncbi:unnamed protein product [Arctogadus glacialis]
MSYGGLDESGHGGEDPAAVRWTPSASHDGQHGARQHSRSLNCTGDPSTVLHGTWSQGPPARDITVALHGEGAREQGEQGGQGLTDGLIDGEESEGQEDEIW